MTESIERVEFINEIIETHIANKPRDSFDDYEYDRYDAVRDLFVIARSVIKHITDIAYADDDIKDEAFDRLGELRSIIGIVLNTSDILKGFSDSCMNDSPIIFYDDDGRYIDRKDGESIKDYIDRGYAECLWIYVRNTIGWRDYVRRMCIRQGAHAKCGWSTGIWLMDADDGLWRKIIE